MFRSAVIEVERATTRGIAKTSAWGNVITKTVTERVKAIIRMSEKKLCDVGYCSDDDGYIEEEGGCSVS